MDFKWILKLLKCLLLSVVSELCINTKNVKLKVFSYMGQHFFHLCCDSEMFFFEYIILADTSNLWLQYRWRLTFKMCPFKNLNVFIRNHQLLSEASESLQNSLIHESQHLMCYSLMFPCSSSKEINFSARGCFDLAQFCNTRKCYPECLQK